MAEGRITFITGVNTVTGANFLFEVADYRLLVDCGAVQGVPDADVINQKNFPFDPAKIDALFVTHAHLDHIGRIGKLVKEGFGGVIYSTEATKELSKLMLEDALHIMDAESRESGTLPLYGPEDLAQALSLWQTVSYGEPKKLSDSLSVTPKDAGHILGSAMYLFSIKDEKEEKTVLFCGDLGNSPSLLLPDTEIVSDADVMVIDSVYGDRNHESKDEREERFKQAILDVVERRGALIIPTFAMDRAQTILYQLNNLIEEKQVPEIPVFLDSPLAIKATEVYERMTHLYNKSVKDDIAGGDSIFSFPRFRETARVWESKKIASVPNPKIILAGSGMSNAGRVLGHETEYLPDPKSTVLFIGYQAPGTLGRELVEGAKKVLIRDKEVEVKAKIENVSGYSGHKDSDRLVEFVGKALPRLKRVFTVLGEPRSASYLAQKLQSEFPIEAVVPVEGKVYEI